MQSGKVRCLARAPVKVPIDAWEYIPRCHRRAFCAACVGWWTIVGGTLTGGAGVRRGAEDQTWR